MEAGYLIRYVDWVTCWTTVKSWFDCRQDNRFFCPSNHQDRLSRQPIVPRKLHREYFFQGQNGPRLWYRDHLHLVPTRHTVGLLLGPWICWGKRTRIASKLALGDSGQKIVGPEPSLGVSRQNIRNKIIGWVDNQHLAMWRGPASTQIQAYKLTTKTRLLSFNRSQSRVVTGLLTGHNTLRRYLNLMRLINNPICWKCGTEEETSIHILCECEALASLRHAYLGSFSCDLENIKSLILGAIWNSSKGTGLL